MSVFGDFLIEQHGNKCRSLFISELFRNNINKKTRPEGHVFVA
jgi:hypothetical protein